ncbi:putative leucine-rich repeat domain superfamily [Helianthus annuus]|nr:putative leucine-rich repeat domain superfamily [Helianthus annuus]
MAFECPTLKFLNVTVSKLSRLDLGLIPNLEGLCLEECNDFVELHMPVKPLKLKFLEISGSKVSNLWLSQHLEKFECLEELTLSIKELKHLPNSICMLKHLKSLKLKSCLLLEKLPHDLDKLECLDELYLTDCTSLRDIPNCVCKMKCLRYLHLPHCVLVKNLPEELGHLEYLKELNIEGTRISHLPQSILQVKGLCIVWSKRRLESYGLSSLKEISRNTASGYVR